MTSQQLLHEPTLEWDTIQDVRNAETQTGEKTGGVGIAEQTISQGESLLCEPAELHSDEQALGNRVGTDALSRGVYGHCTSPQLATESTRP
jgi:hypothetical protein